MIVGIPINFSDHLKQCWIIRIRFKLTLKDVRQRFKFSLILIGVNQGFTCLISTEHDFDT